MSDNGLLTMQGERKEEQDEKGRKIHRIERSYGRFVQTSRFPIWWMTSR